MALYSANGYKRTIDVQATLASDDALILKTELPNASPFGWTSADLTSVKDLAVWVNTAMEAAQSAEQNSEYIASIVKFIEDAQTEFEHKADQLDSDIARLNDISKLFSAQEARINAAVTQTNQNVDTMKSIQTDIANRQKIIEDIYQAIIDMDPREGNIDK